jgi:hypothetical protein
VCVRPPDCSPSTERVAPPKLAQVDIRKLQKLVKQQREELAAARTLFADSVKRLEQLRKEYPQHMPKPVQSNDADFVGLHGYRSAPGSPQAKDASWFGWMGF